MLASFKALYHDAAWLYFRIFFCLLDIFQRLRINIIYNFELHF